MASGAFAPGQLHSDAFCDLIRVTKQGAHFISLILILLSKTNKDKICIDLSGPKLGGIIMWSMRTDYGPISPRFANFDAHVEDLVTNGVWKHYVPCKTIKPYVHSSEGYIYTMQRI